MHRQHATRCAAQTVNQRKHITTNLSVRMGYGMQDLPPVGPPPPGWPPFRVPPPPPHNRSSLLPSPDPTAAGPLVGSIQTVPREGAAPADASTPTPVARSPSAHADDAGGGDLGHDSAIVLGALAAAVLLGALACIAAVRWWKHRRRPSARKAASGRVRGGEAERTGSCGSKLSTGSYRVRLLHAYMCCVLCKRQTVR